MIEIPKQLSAAGEHGFPIAPVGRKVRVTINGDSRRAVVAYDINAGWVESAALDERGLVLLRGDEWVYKREYGTVGVVILD